MQYKVIYICSAKPGLNKTVLRRRLKDVVDWWSLISVGRLFQMRGAATANSLSPNFLRVRGLDLLMHVMPVQMTYIIINRHLITVVEGRYTQIVFTETVVKR